MKRLLREPFLHFVLLGVAVFAADALLRERSTEISRDEIVVTPGRIENLAAIFARTWQRPPTSEELTALIDGYVLEEALYREGLTLGVDQDDAVIRRRVRQKMDFFVDDLVAMSEPDEAELENWLAENLDDYLRPPRYTLRQVFLNTEQRVANIEADAEHLRELLNTGDDANDPRLIGDRSLLPFELVDSSSTDVSRNFGPDFAAALAGLPTGSWEGPIASPYGQHLVFIESVTPAATPLLAEVRDAVARDLENARRDELSRSFYSDLVAQYDVTIEWPEASDETVE